MVYCESICEYRKAIMTFPIGFLCIHPCFNKEKGEDVMTIPYCPKEKYEIIDGIAVWWDDLDSYINHIKNRIELINNGVIINSCLLEKERERMHNVILEDAGQDRGSRFDIKLSEYIENYLKLVMRGKDGTNL